MTEILDIFRISGSLYPLVSELGLYRPVTVMLECERRELRELASRGRRDGTPEESVWFRGDAEDPLHGLRDSHPPAQAPRADPRRAGDPARGLDAFSSRQAAAVVAAHRCGHQRLAAGRASAGRPLQSGQEPEVDDSLLGR